MTGDMRDNLKHYLDLIKWLLNKEKTIKMNERIFDALLIADAEGRLPTMGEIAAVKESAQALEDSYRRLLLAKTFAQVRKLVEISYGLRTSQAYNDGPPAPTWKDSLTSSVYWLTFPIDELVSLCFEEDKNRMYIGYYGPPEIGEEFSRFLSFLRKEGPSALQGITEGPWYAYKYLTIDGTRQENADYIADLLGERHRTMKELVRAFKGERQSAGTKTTPS
jgi:hypothetical protein